MLQILITSNVYTIVYNMINPQFCNEIVRRFFDQYFNPLLLHDFSLLPITLVIEEADIKQSRYSILFYFCQGMIYCIECLQMIRFCIYAFQKIHDPHVCIFRQIHCNFVILLKPTNKLISVNILAKWNFDWWKFEIIIHFHFSHQLDWQ